MALDTDIAYLAGIVDGEGCIRIVKTKPYKHLTGRVTPGYKVSIQVRMVEEKAIAFLSDTLGGWYWAEKTAHSKNGRPLFCWQATDTVAQNVLTTILPYLRIKKPQAELALRFQELRSHSREHRTKVTGTRLFAAYYGPPRQVRNFGLSDEYVAQCEDFYLQAREMNKVGIG